MSSRLGVPMKRLSSCELISLLPVLTLHHWCAPAQWQQSSTPLFLDLFRSPAHPWNIFGAPSAAAGQCCTAASTVVFLWGSSCCSRGTTPKPSCCSPTAVAGGNVGPHQDGTVGRSQETGRRTRRGGAWLCGSPPTSGGMSTSRWSRTTATPLGRPSSGTSGPQN